MLSCSPRLPYAISRVLGWQSELERELECSPQVFDAVRIAEVDACDSAHRQRSNDVLEPYLSSELDRLVRPLERLFRLSAEGVDRRHAAVGHHELRAWATFEQRDGFSTHLPGADREAVPPERTAEVRECKCGSTILAGGAQNRNRLVVCGLTLGQTPLRLQCVAELHEHAPALCVVGDHGERAAVRTLGGRNVEAHRTVPRQHGEADKSFLELLRVAGLPSRTTKLQRLRVVVSEELRVIREAPFGRELDPLGRLDVLPAARRARDLLVGDIADEDVPEGEFLLVAHGRDPRRTHELAPDELAEPGQHLVARRDHPSQRVLPSRRPSRARMRPATGS